MFVTDNPSGVNKSCDAGKTWNKENAGITSRTGPSNEGIPIFSLTIDPNDPDIVWAGTQFANGVYRSVDGGSTWEKKVNGIVEGNEITFRGFAIRPGDSETVFAAAEITTYMLGKEFDKTKGKIYKTVDGGDDWRCVWEGNNLARVVLFNPGKPDVMYASTGIFDREAYDDTGVGILKSTDGGEHWFPINDGISDSEGNRFLGFLEMHPTNPELLFAAAGNNTYGPGGVFRTANGGANWEKVLSGDIMTVVVVSRSNPNVIYAGSSGAFYRSDDGGTNWQEYRKEPSGYGPLGIRAGVPIGAVVDPTNPMTIFSNNYGGGIFKSVDGSRTWDNSSRGYTGAHMHDIAIDADHPAVVYAIGRCGPFGSRNAGDLWSGLAFSPASCAEWNAVAVNPANSREVLISDEYEGRIFKSTDGGDTWRMAFKHPGSPGNDPKEIRHGFRRIVYAPSNPLIVYAGMSKCRRTIDGDFPPRASFGMYKSVDGGETWQAINDGLQGPVMNILCIAVHPTNSDTVYIGTWQDGVFETTNGGQNWVNKTNGLTSAEVRSLAVDPDNPLVIYAGLGQGRGIFKTSNGGELWEEANAGVKLLCPSYMLPSGGGIRGVSLNQPPKKATGMDYYSVPWTSIWDIVIDPTNTQTVYAADHHAGVLLSVDGGANWVPINDGLSMKAVTALAISSSGKVLYAATEGAGVFRWPVDFTGGEGEGEGEGEPPGGCFAVATSSPSSDLPLGKASGDSLLLILTCGVFLLSRRRTIFGK
jgi:photosystem II stability/assembly factor-like uncharacterized protein